MADDNMVTDPVGSQMEQSAAEGDQAIQSQPPPGQGDVAPQQDPVQALQAKEDDTVSSGDGTDAQRPKGTLSDQRKAILAKDPKAKLPATPSMQAQYIQLVTRFLLFIHDIRHTKDVKSPCENFIRQMNNPKLSVAQAVGQATANAIFILHNGAKHQKVSYNPNVMFRAADECVIAMYLMGSARGIFQGVPKFRGKKAGVKYKFDDSEKMLILKAKMYAVQWFGHLMVKSGQISPQDQKQAQDHWQKMIKQEISSGQVTDAHVNALMQNPKVKEQMSQVAPDNTPSGNEASLDTSTGQAQQQGQAQPQPQGQGQAGGGGDQDVAPEQPPQGGDQPEQQ